MSANEIIAELAKLERRELERVDAQLHQLLETNKTDGTTPSKRIDQVPLESAGKAHGSLTDHVEPNEPVADETHIGLEDFPQFPNLHLTHEDLSRDVIYDARGR